MVSYKPLFRLLLDRGITKTQLRQGAGFSTATLANITKNEYISLKTIDKICQYLDCSVEDVVEFKKG